LSDGFGVAPGSGLTSSAANPLREYNARRL
jgi:hypothetical protein